MKKPLSLLSRIRVLRALKGALLAAGLLSALTLLLLIGGFCYFTFWLLPHLDDFRPVLERQLSQSLGRKVQVNGLSGRWLQVAPQFDLQGISIANPQDGRALTFRSVSVVPAWSSLLAWEPRLSSIVIKGPEVELRRSPANIIYLNGFDISSGPADNSAGNWLLQQSSLQIDNARLSWQDELLGLPRLDLQQGQLSLGRGLLGHRLKLSGVPAATLGQRFELSANWRGDDIGQWQDWSGSVKVALNGARAGAWSRYMQQLGFLRSGEGDGVVEMSFSDGAVDSLLADVSVRDAAYTPPSAQELELPRLEGKLQLTRQRDGSYRVKADHLTLASASGLAFDQSSIQGEWQPGGTGRGELTLDNVNVNHLSPFIHALGVDRNPLFARFSPSGELHEVTVGWDGPLEAPQAFHVRSRFKNLAWQPFDGLPGVSGVSGRIAFNQQGGQLQLDNGKSGVVYPAVFAQPLDFDRLQAAVDWKRNNGALDIQLKEVSFANADLKGRLQGSYRHAGSGSGSVNLTASVDQVAARRVPAYLPHQVGEQTMVWLKEALQDGMASKVSMALRGELDAFPFVGGEGGEFLVEADVAKARLLYQKGWPTIDDIDARLRFHNEKVEVIGRQASTIGVRLKDVRVTIDNLAADVPWLHIDGGADDQLQKMLAFTTRSPVDGWLGGFTGGLKGEGKAGLKLKLAIPLAGTEDVKVRGDIKLAGNRLAFSRLPLPPLEAIHGALTFTERGVDSKGLNLRAFGGPFRLEAHTGADKRMRFVASGEADSREALRQYLPPLAPLLDGRSRYQASFVVRDGLESLQVGSDLQGTRLNAPAPLAKAAADKLPLQLQLRPASGRGDSAGLRLDFSLDGQLAGRLRLSDDGGLQAGAIGLGRSPGDAPRAGLAVRLRQPRIALEEWLSALSGLGGAADAGGADFPLLLELETPLFSAYGMELHQLSAKIGNQPPSTLWDMTVRSREMSGEASYQTAGHGMLQANLSRLALNWPQRNAAAGAPQAAAGAGGNAPQKLPPLKVKIGELLLQGRTIGKVEMDARREGSLWTLDPLRLTTAESGLQASVRVDDQGAGSVDTRFTLQTGNAGQLLGRFGLDKVFNNGQGTLSGQLGWPGGLGDLDGARMSGQLALDFKNGRFAQIDPGVARLLGVLSLQSLPRRIRLDFTDVFSQGFAFDTLKGEAAARSGVFASRKVEMKSPAAEVAISGEVNLAKETQTLAVHVTPHLAESVALAAGAALLNPVVGIATLAAQKVLQDPVGKILSVDYAVTGSLKDPQVVRTNIGPQVNLKGSKP